MCETVANACGSSKIFVVSSIILLFSQKIFANSKKRALISYTVQGGVGEGGTVRELNGKQNQYERRDCGVVCGPTAVR
jgi:hypothetical protein